MIHFGGVNVKRPFVFALSYFSFEIGVLSFVVKREEFWQSLIGEGKMFDTGLDKSGWVFEVSVEDDFHHGFYVFFVLFWGQKDVKVFGQEVLQVISVLANCVAEHFINGLQNKLNKSSLGILWGWATSKFLIFMIEVVISPQKFRESMNIDIFEPFLVLEGHTQVWEHESVFCWCKDYVIEIGRKLVCFLVNPKLTAVLSEKSIDLLQCVFEF